MSYLIDTNVLSELVRTKPNQHVINWFKQVPDNSLYISTLTIGELRKGIESLKDLEKKEKMRLWLEHELNGWFQQRILSIDQYIAERWGRLQSEMKHPLPAIDSLIAATALHHDLRLVTRNIKDFYFPGLEVVNPWL